MIQNISRPDASLGSVVASQSRENPNYYFHWVRDASIVMLEIFEIYRRLENSEQKEILHTYLEDYFSFSQKLQRAPVVGPPEHHLGEPKFFPDGSLFTDPWGRPQNDGPALRAIVASLYAQSIASTEFEHSRKLYDQLIKPDLEYISHRWKNPSFDIWEEVYGIHFYTLSVQHRALTTGAVLARRINDPGAADWYETQAENIRQVLELFWNEEKGYFEATRYRVWGLDYKDSNLDASVLLGVLHGHVYSVDDSRVRRTVKAIKDVFADLYPLNRDFKFVPMIGRYPEDRYNAGDNRQGNPWILLTNALAEYHYRLSDSVAQRGLPQNVVSAFHELGDRFLYRTYQFRNVDGSLPEQVHREFGAAVSARDLTWSGASVISALRHR